MNSWATETLGTLCDNHGGAIQTGPFGSQLHQHDYVPEGTPVIMPKDIKHGKIELREIARIDDDNVKRLSKHKVKVGDIIIPRRGEISKCTLITGSEVGYVCGTGCLKITPPTAVLDATYFRYYLSRSDVIEWLENNAIGATMLNLSGAILKRLPVSLPCLLEQQKIAAILSTYDDLIENNLERIKLLEEIAQITYEEWFVRMKFPGHEEVEIDSETGLPDYWEEQDLSQYISIKHGFAYKGEFFSEGETNRVLLTPGNFKIGGGIKLDKVKYYDEDAESPEGYVLNQHDLLVTMTDLSKMADTLGFPLLVPSSKTKKFLHNQRLGKVLPVGDSSFPKYFYYMLFQDERYRAFVVGSATGATVKHSSPSKILAYKPQLPPLDGELIFKFNDVTKPIFETIDLLMKESELLREARDILLPRLMTGMIDIEKVELPEALLDRINKENNNEINID